MVNSKFGSCDDGEHNFIPYTYKNGNFLSCTKCSYIAISPYEKKRKCVNCGKKKLTTPVILSKTNICQDCLNEYEDNSIRFFSGLVELMVNYKKEGLK